MARQFTLPSTEWNQGRVLTVWTNQDVQWSDSSWNNSTVTVQNASDLSWNLDPAKVYIIDWIIDMWSTSIIVPTAWLTLRWFWFEKSKLISSNASFKLFITDWVNYSGDLFLDSLWIEVTWTGSQVFDLDNDWNLWAIESTVVNFNNCTSLWEISNYRQWLELNTWRFWGTPNFTFSWTWQGWYRLDTSIVRWLDAWMTWALFQSGTWLTFWSRFFTNMNCDLSANVAFCDFQSSNIVNPSNLQIEWAIFSRNLVIDANDSNIFPNITSSDLKSSFRNNQWVTNTYVWWENTITSEILTVIPASWTFVTLNWTFTASNLQHFDSPLNWQLRHLWNIPREFRIISDIILEWWSNDEVVIRIRKFNNSTTSFETVFEQWRQVNNLLWWRDVAFFNIISNVTLDSNDYVFLEVTNNTDTTSVTAENSSFFIVQER